MTETPSSSPPSATPAAEAPRRAADSSDRAYAMLREALIGFRFAPGERIRELRIAEELDLSRSPVREALNRLASEGFVTLLPNRGFVARAFDPDDLLNLYDLRAVLETAAFERMCRRADDAELAALARFWAGVQHVYAAHDADAILAADEQFHLMIARASGNTEIVELLETINARLRFVRRVLIAHARHDADLVQSHEQLVAAALKRDTATGLALMKSHIALTFDVAREALANALDRQRALAESRRPPKRRRKTT